ncbi:MAG: hypothetical protein QOK49_1227 [Baekduia sp.]|jgi:hypothetical protein|nr:hypothetical protein [Baekduia sp.]
MLPYGTDARDELLTRLSLRVQLGSRTTAAAVVRCADAFA